MSLSIAAEADSYNATLSLGTLTQISMCGWVNITTDRNAISIPLGMYNGSNSDYICVGTTTDGTTWRAFDEGAQTGNGQAMTVGTWYFAAFSVNGVNGNLWTRAANSSTYTNVTWSTFSANTNASTIRIGRHDGTGLWFAGKIAGVKLWTGATLTLADFQNESLTFVPQRFTNLKAWYPLLAAETQDWSGNGNTLTAGSGTTNADNPPISWQGTAHTIFIPNSITAVDLNDTGSSDASLNVAAAVSLGDTGSSLETLNANSATPLSDSASAIESLAVSVAVALSDTANASEAIVVARAAFLNDTASSTQTLTANAAVNLADAANSTESISVTNPVALGDTASSTQILTANSATPLTDIAFSTEALTATVSTSLTDTGSSTEALTHSVALSLTDSASSTESLSVVATSVLADAANSSEALTSAAQVSLADSASAADMLLQGALKDLGDSGSATESLSVTVALSLAEMASGTEDLTASVSVFLADIASASDSLLSGAPEPEASRGVIVEGASTGTTMVRTFRDTSEALGVAGTGTSVDQDTDVTTDITTVQRETSKINIVSRRGPQMGGS